jgi:hypothetical protein
MSLTYRSFTLLLLSIPEPLRGLLLLHLVVHSSGVSIMLVHVALSFYSLSVEPYSRVGVSAMQILNALAEAALATSTVGTDVTKVTVISRVLRDLGATQLGGNELVYQEAIFNIFQICLM